MHTHNRRLIRLLTESVQVTKAYELLGILFPKALITGYKVINTQQNQNNFNELYKIINVEMTEDEQIKFVIGDPSEHITGDWRYSSDRYINNAHKFSKYMLIAKPSANLQIALKNNMGTYDFLTIYRSYGEIKNMFFDGKIDILSPSEFVLHQAVRQGNIPVLVQRAIAIDGVDGYIYLFGKDGYYISHPTHIPDREAILMAIKSLNEEYEDVHGFAKYMKRIWRNVLNGKDKSVEILNNIKKLKCLGKIKIYNIFIK